MSACIYYAPEAYTTSGPKLMGRHAAGESFLRGFLTHSKFVFRCLVWLVKLGVLKVCP